MPRPSLKQLWLMTVYVHALLGFINVLANFCGRAVVPLEFWKAVLQYH